MPYALSVSSTFEAVDARGEVCAPASCAPRLSGVFHNASLVLAEAEAEAAGNGTRGRTCYRMELGPQGSSTNVSLMMMQYTKQGDAFRWLYVEFRRVNPCAWHPGRGIGRRALIRRGAGLRSLPAEPVVFR